MKRLPLILSLVLFIGLCASASFWVMQFMKPVQRKISAPPMAKPVADVESVAGLFGGALAVNTNYQLKGIILANPAEQSGAIIAVDGKPTQAYRMKAEINTGVTLSEVHATYILIMDNGVSKRIDLPQDFKASAAIGGYSDAPSMRAPLPGPAGQNNAVNSNGMAVRQTTLNPDNALAAQNARLRRVRPLPPAQNNPPPPEDANNTSTSDH
ncbi:general secretion pathway protein C [Oxalobacteraceae bacterium GrIS 2.11]